MYSIKNIVRKNIYFLLPYFSSIVLITPLLILFNKNTTHLYLNQFHSAFLDKFFVITTNLGDGTMPFILGGIILFFSYRFALIIPTSGTIAGLIAQFLKRIVFPDAMRPYAIFKDYEGYHLVNGIAMHSSFSFPSGHSATIFAITFCLAAFTKNKIAKVLLFLIAAIVAYSRIYLSRHFLVDIYFGSLLGVFTALFTIFLFQRFQNSWMDKSLLHLRKSNTNNG